MASHKHLNHQGMTLVEILVALALFGVLALGTATLLFDNGKFNQKSRNEVALSDMLEEFVYSTDTYLSNTTQMISCACGNSCIFDDSSSPNCMISGACSDPLIRLEYEDANDPSMTSASSDCLFDGVTIAGATLLGCKKRIRLSYTQPVAANPGPGAPGVLRIDLEDNSGNVVRALSSLTGVTSLRCGHRPVNPSAATLVPSSDSFRIELSMKARMTNEPVPLTGMDGWHPSDTGYLAGTHRAAAADFTFKNLNVAGVQFGKPTSVTSCAANGQSNTNAPCCSGYNDASNICISSATCSIRGSATIGVAGSACCSLTASAGACL